MRYIRLIALVFFVCMGSSAQDQSYYAYTSAKLWSSWAWTSGSTVNSGKYLYGVCKWGGSGLGSFDGTCLSYFNPAAYVSLPKFLESLNTYLHPENIDEELISAVEGKDGKRVNELLLRGAKAKYHLKPPSVYAAEAGDLSILTFLVNSGADPNQPHPDSGVTPLMVAAQRGDISMIEWLKAHDAQLDAFDAVGRSALSYAIESRQTGVLSLLASEGTINARDIHGRPPLVNAAGEKGSKVVRTLLQSPDIDVNIGTPLEISALLLALQARQKKTAQLLHDAGALVGEEERAVFVRNGWEKDLKHWRRMCEPPKQKANYSDDPFQGMPKDTRSLWRRVLYPRDLWPQVPYPDDDEEQHSEEEVRDDEEGGDEGDLVLRHSKPKKVGHNN